jgi:hypothetical protein
MVLLKKRMKKMDKEKEPQPRDRLKFLEKIKIKLLEWPALLRAKKEEKQHLPTFQELKKETHEFEKEAIALRSLIRKKRATRTKRKKAEK